MTLTGKARDTISIDLNTTNQTPSRCVSYYSLYFVSLTRRSRTSLLNPPLGFAYLYA